MVQTHIHLPVIYIYLWTALLLLIPGVVSGAILWWQCQFYIVECANHVFKRMGKGIIPMHKSLKFLTHLCLQSSTHHNARLWHIHHTYSVHWCSGIHHPCDKSSAFLVLLPTASWPLENHKPFWFKKSLCKDSKPNLRTLSVNWMGPYLQPQQIHPEQTSSWQGDPDHSLISLCHSSL